jgi:hypothetical protein
MTILQALSCSPSEKLAKLLDLVEHCNSHDSSTTPPWGNTPPWNNSMNYPFA